MIKALDEYKKEIELQEAVTDKLIIADPFNKKPKTIHLKEMFKNLFPEKKKEQSPEEIAKRFRSVMRAEKGKWQDKPID